MTIALVIDSIFVKFLQLYKERKLIKKIEKNISINKNDFVYYREILDGYTPAILAYCYKKDIKLDDIIIATLLDLERKNKIKIQDGKIVTNIDINKMNITEYEKDILLHCIKKELITKKGLYIKIKNEAYRRGLIRIGNQKDINATYIMELFIAWIIIYILIAGVPLFAYSTIGGWVFAAYFVVFLCVPIYKTIQSRIKFIIRTNEGIEIAAKMQGLKKYIKDFSSLQDKGIKHIEIFEEYIIYAIILNLQGNLNEEVKEVYAKISKCQ